MNWVKKNTFLAGLIAVVVIVGGILGYLTFSAYSNYNAVTAEYDSQVSKLQQLQNRTPFPSDANIKRYAELAAEYKDEYTNLLAEVGKMQPPLETISPQAFQDRLRSVVSEVEAAAQTAGVTLAPEFYMGFDQYRGQLPGDNAAGALARQLGAVQAVVNALIENRVKSIDSITRTPLPEEGGAPPPETRNPRDNRPANSREEKASVVSAYPFEITFTAEQGRLRQSLNAIVRSSQFFIIRYLTVANSSLEGPPRAPVETAYVDPAAEPTPNPDGSMPTPNPEGTQQTADPERPALNVIVGRETLTVAARIEMITFNTPEAKN